MTETLRKLTATSDNEKRRNCQRDLDESKVICLYF
jgi:hypothetical protein